MGDGSQRGRVSSCCDCMVAMTTACARVGAEIESAIDGAALWCTRERGVRKRGK